MKHYRPFRFTRNGIQTLAILRLKRGVHGLARKSGRAAFLGIATGLGIGSTAALAQDIPAVRACDVAAASTTDTLLPPGIVGVPTDRIDPKIAIPACQKAIASAPENGRIVSELAHAYLATKEYDKARSLFATAAQRGYADAQFTIGLLSAQGRWGFPKNDAEAVRYLKLASAQGHAWAELVLGQFYAEGRGGLRVDATEAARLTKLAAEEGLSEAEYSLGLIYEQGSGVARDYAQATFWYGKAAALGDKDAKAKLAELSGAEPDTSANEIKLACDGQTFAFISPAKKYVKLQEPNLTIDFKDGATGELLGVMFSKQYVFVGENVIRFGGVMGSGLASVIFNYEIDRRTGLLTSSVRGEGPRQCSALPNTKQF